jgi:hypothetical protein
MLVIKNLSPGILSTGLVSSPLSKTDTFFFSAYSSTDSLGAQPQDQKKLYKGILEKNPRPSNVLSLQHEVYGTFFNLACVNVHFSEYIPTSHF